MPRVVYTAIPASAPDYREIEVITPHPPAARAVGAPHRSLLAVARLIAQENGFQTARPLFARRLLVNAVARVRDGRGETRGDFEAQATRLTPLLKTVLRTGVNTTRLREFGSPRANELAEVTDAYRSLLRAQNLIDSEESLLFAAGQQFEPRRLYLHGYFRARVQEVAFINTLCADDSVLVLPHHDAPMFGGTSRALEQLQRSGWQPETPPSSTTTAGATAAEKFRGGRTSGAAITAFEYPDPDAEVRGALGRVKRLLIKGVSPSAIALAANDPARYGAALAAAAGEYGVPIRRNFRVSLAETRFGSWLSLLVEAARHDLPFEPTMRLIAHPFAAALNGRGSGDWRSARATHVRGREGWAQTATRLDCLAWPERDTRSNWNARLTGCLRELRIRAICCDSARDLTAFDTLTGELGDDFHGKEMLWRDEFADEMVGFLNDLDVDADGGSGGVELLDPQTIIGGQYEHLFILGAVDGILPERPSDNPVIDFHERGKLAAHGIEFEGAADIARWEDLAFHFLLSAARAELHLSCPRTIDGKPQVPSAYLDRLGLKPERPVGKGAVFSREEWRQYAIADGSVAEDVTRHARRAHQIELSRESATPYDEFDGITGIAINAAKRTWSASQLLKLGQCPFHWFADKGLRLAAPEEPMLGLAANVRGLLFHKTLELALADVPLGEDPRGWALSKLNESFEAAEADAEVALPLLPAWPAQRLELLDQLRRAINSDGFMVPDARVVGREAKFVTQWHGLPVMGYIDRVDRTPAGLMLIDYKTGGKPKGIKDATGELKVDIQLPIYIEAAAPALYGDQPVAGGAYFSIARGKVLAEVGSAPAPALAQFAEAVKDRLAEGRFPVEPDPQQHACTFCDYAVLCRRGHRLTRKPVS